MSMLTMQADSLRKHAERLRQLANGAVNQGFPARQDLFESAAEMREAADTIESLRDRLQEHQHNNPLVGLTRGKHHEKHELSDCYCGRCGYPVTDHDSYCRECGGAFHGSAIQLSGDKSWLHEHQGVGDESRYTALFGTPEKAARTMAGKCCDCCECVLADACEHGCGEGCLLGDESNFDTLLEWLRGDA